MGFLNYFQIRQINFWDVLDICIIWFVLYYLFRFMRGRSTVQIALGLFALFATRFLAVKFQLVVVGEAIGWLFNIIPIAVIVLFQDEIRTVLASLGSNPFSLKTVGEDSTYLDNIFQAALTLSKDNTGALIVFEREQGLLSYMETGTRLDALSNTELLLDIFQPKSHLHDGAVIVSKRRLAAAACIMPLARGADIPKHFGTRHRAAIGISEETDCVSLVVSEETGRISFCEAGQIYTLGENSLIKLYETYNSLLMTDDKDRAESLRSIATKPKRKKRKAAKG